VDDFAEDDDFKDQGVKSEAGGYGYDGAGRMVSNAKKGISLIEYNYLDLPRRIEGGEITVEFTYDASGRKWLHQTDKISRMYVGNLTYVKVKKDYILEAAATPHGRIVFDDENDELFAEYHHQEHLGNVRVTFTDRNQDGKVELLGETSELGQVMDYYPFGMVHKGVGMFGGQPSSNRYRFNGIEVLEEFDLELAPFRSYDASIGRWSQVDPIYKFGESGYAGMANNPVLYADPMGLDTSDNPVNTLPMPTVVDDKPAPLPSAAPARVSPLPVPVPTSVPSSSPHPSMTPTSAPSKALKVAGRMLGVVALLLHPSQLGQGSDMPAYYWEDSRDNNNGYALVTHYRTDESNGHFSVQVVMGNNTLSTHQQILKDGISTVIEPPGINLIMYDSRVVRFELPSAQRALIYQRRVMGQPGGPYDPVTNSCMTHVCDVLRHGGLPVPTSFVGQARWGKKLFQGLY
jgi:RHS repeat-associated protein